MLVVNQDMLITGGDFVAPIVAGVAAGVPTGGSGYYPASALTDITTSTGSFFYDMGRITGNIPNVVSAGWTIKGDLYILIYP
jgi:hypothetical protein